MRRRFQQLPPRPAVLAVTFLLCASAGGSPQAREGEEKLAQAWMRAFALESGPKGAGSSWLLRTPPFSFVYDSRESTGFLPGWRQICAQHKDRAKSGDAGTDPNRAAPGDDAASSDTTCSDVTFTDPETGLEVKAEVLGYGDVPAVEWVLRFRNTGSSATQILEKILPLDTALAFSPHETSQPVLYYARGALCSIDDFAPVERPLDPGTTVTLQPGGGRSSSEVLPFFNLQLGTAGLVLGIGWTGEWRASFRRREDGAVEVTAGMALTHLRLHPGEEIRSPRILALFWEGDRRRGNNLLRRLLLRHHCPRPDGKPLTLPVVMGSWGGTPAADHLRSIRRIVENQLPIDLYWIDAEWFGTAPWWQSSGNWDVRKELYPQGFMPISQALHESGRKLLLWFEPQRVCARTPWSQFKERPGWLLELGDGTPAYRQRNMNWGIPHEDPRWVEWESRRSQITEGDLLWNMGDPGARAFLTDFISSGIAQFGLDWYREDFNIAPIEYWRHADAPDRQGMTEIRYVEGLYGMWDDLLSRHRHLAIDNCASGGRRIDLETIGRSTALWRTDWPADAIHKQCHTFGLLEWIPLHMSGGAVLRKGNEYEIRSAMTAGLNVELPPEDDPESMREARRLIEEYLGIQRFYHGDYFPLTPYSQAPDAWLAYQLALEGEGIVVALKRPQSQSPSLRVRLYALDAGVPYTVTNLDTKRFQVCSGQELLETGLEVRLEKSPDSAVLRYARAPGTAPSPQ